jgi:hypothetical protein
MGGSWVAVGDTCCQGEGACGSRRLQTEEEKGCLEEGEGDVSYSCEGGCWGVVSVALAASATEAVARAVITARGSCVVKRVASEVAAS